MPQSVALLFCDDESDDVSANCSDDLSRDSGALEVSHDRAAAKQVITVLRSTELQLLRRRNWRDLRRCAAATHAAVITAARLDLVVAATALRETECDGFPCPLVLVTNDERDNLRHLGRARVDHVIYTDEVEQLAQLLPCIALSDGRLMLRAAICRREMHATLQKALLELVDTALPKRATIRRLCRRLPRTVEGLAALADVTADYLRHLATQARLPIGRIVRRYAALQALELFAAGVSATVVADYFGYRDRSGVDKFIRHNLGGRRGHVLQSGLQPYYAHIARLVAATNPAKIRTVS